MKNLLSLIHTISMRLLLSGVLIYSSLSSANEIVLSDPSKSKKALFVKELLTISYQRLGYKVRWVKNVSSRELSLVSSGKLSGALARAPIIESNYPDLVRVPFPILKFSMLKVSDRERCGFCLNEQITSFAYVKGSVISEKYVETISPDIRTFALTASDKLNEMVQKRRVDSMLVMDFQIDPEIYLNPNLLIESVDEELDYHYLGPTFSHLKEPLLEVLNDLNQEGMIAKLEAKYQIKLEQRRIKPNRKIKAVSGNWTGYTNSDGSGVYWNIVKSIFGKSFTVETSEYTWQRAKILFEKKQADLLVGAYISDNTGDFLFSSYHIDFEYPLYVFAQNQHILDKFQNKESDISACVMAGTEMKNYIDFLPIENVFMTNLEQCNTLFAKGKVDVVVEYHYNLDKELIKRPKAILKNAEPLFVVFHNNETGHYLKALFDKSISTLAQQDKLRALYLTDENFEQANIQW
ncbi:hypothetical protein [Thalassotalea atypica]|uniref:hypothetical protein n=1 Tax=Thalassotalea atypica TaxID=2054316 RepID=UPI002572972E|nr:hypothetical protein [Thalassotalea atypica]